MKIQDRMINFTAKLLPILLIVLYFLHSSYYTKKEEEILYNNIPNIKVYDSPILLKDDLKINGRNPKYILAKGRYLVEGSGNDIRRYYKFNLEQQGWVETNYYRIKNDYIHYGDGFVFEKGIYRIALDIYPPIDNKWSDFETSVYLNNKKPYYNIYFGEKKMISKEWRDKD